MKKVLVFAERMLPSTQTFIPLQVNELQRYSPQYVGLIPADRNLDLPYTPVMLTHDRGQVSRVRRELYRWTGAAPSFHARLRNMNADLIHAHFAEGGPAALSLSQHLRLPLVLHLRGGAELLPDHELRRHLFQLPFLVHRKRLWQRASLFLCVSNFIRE
jgi:colanic acid/amylovoran biosynthesis glycosyltransferase